MSHTWWTNRSVNTHTHKKKHSVGEVGQMVSLNFDEKHAEVTRSSTIIKTSLELMMRGESDTDAYTVPIMNRN